MTKAQIKKFVGKRVLLRWRDPATQSDWSAKPLKFSTAKVETVATVCGLNVRGEIILGSSRGREDEEFGLLTVIPLPCIEDIRELDFTKTHRRRR